MLCSFFTMYCCPSGLTTLQSMPIDEQVKWRVAKAVELKEEGNEFYR